jgi:hypothetical protein
VFSIKWIPSQFATPNEGLRIASGGQKVNNGRRDSAGRQTILDRQTNEEKDLICKYPHAAASVNYLRCCATSRTLPATHLCWLGRARCGLP